MTFLNKPLANNMFDQYWHLLQGAINYFKYLILKRKKLL